VDQKGGLVRLRFTDPEAARPGLQSLLESAASSPPAAWLNGRGLRATDPTDLF